MCYWAVVLRGWCQTLHSECPCTSSGRGVKNKTHPRLTSQRVSEVFAFRPCNFPPCVRECPGCTADKWTACNMSQNTRLQVNMRPCSFHFCFPSGFLQEKENQELTTDHKGCPYISANRAAWGQAISSIQPASLKSQPS